VALASGRHPIEQARARRGELHQQTAGRWLALRSRFSVQASSRRISSASAAAERNPSNSRRSCQPLLMRWPPPSPVELRKIEPQTTAAEAWPEASGWRRHARSGPSVSGPQTPAVFLRAKSQHIVLGLLRSQLGSSNVQSPAGATS